VMKSLHGGVSVRRNEVDEMFNVKKKRFYEEAMTTKSRMRNKYVVRYYDGVTNYDDGSPLYHIEFFKNKKAKDKFMDELRKKGYVYQ
jgi:hypothetical protein